MHDQISTGPFQEFPESDNVFRRCYHLMQLYVISKFQIKVDITFFLSFGLASSSTVLDRGSRALRRTASVKKRRQSGCGWGDGAAHHAGSTIMPSLSSSHLSLCGLKSFTTATAIFLRPVFDCVISLSQSPVPMSNHLSSQINSLNHCHRVVTYGFLQLPSISIPVLAPRPW